MLLVNEKKGTMILGFEEAIFSPMSKMGVLLHVSVIVPFFSMDGSRFVFLSACTVGIYVLGVC